jgi:serine/threonine-protein kinase
MSPEGQLAEALVGTTLEGGYRIECLLGVGGMGSVYKATHIRLAKHVAVKVMASELTASSESLARFHREALITGSLGHPHIVQVFDLSTTPAGQPFLVMEFLEGEDLDQRLNRVRRLPTADVVHIVKQVASALDATHAKGIVHRDLKPANIYLLKVAGETNFVKVLDFGISKMRAATRQLTRTSSVMGTPNYMSPEQALGKNDEVDERTDQWALACIVWECLSGQRAFDGEEGTSILYQVVHEPPPSLLAKVPGLRPSVEAVLLRALAKNKDQRFPHVIEFVTALECAMNDAVVPVLGIPRTVKLPDSPDAKPSPPTTLSRTSGELAGASVVSAAGSRKGLWIAAIGATAAVSLAAVLLLRPGRASNQAVVAPATAPAQYVPPPPAPPAPPPPTPNLEMVPASKEAPSRVEAAAAKEETEPEPKAPRSGHSPRLKVKRPKPGSDAKSEGVPAIGVPTLPKKPNPAKKSEEEEDKWRLD